MTRHELRQPPSGSAQIRQPGMTGRDATLKCRVESQVAVSDAGASPTHTTKEDRRHQILTGDRGSLSSDGPPAVNIRTLVGHPPIL